nr:MAG TPA: hypothetical protein [Caudoviricetes sp.]
MQNVKEVAVILGGLAAFLVIGTLAGNLLALSGAFNNHITLKLRKGKHNRANNLTGRGVVHNPHVQDVHRNALINELVYQFKAILGRTSDTVKFRHDQRVSRLDFNHQLVQFRSMQLRAGVNIRKDFLCAICFQKFRLGFKAVAVNRLSSGTDTSVTVNHPGSPSFSKRGFFLKFFCFPNKIIVLKLFQPIINQVAAVFYRFITFWLDYNTITKQPAKFHESFNRKAISPQSFSHTRRTFLSKFVCPPSPSFVRVSSSSVIYQLFDNFIALHTGILSFLMPL